MNTNKGPGLRERRNGETRHISMVLQLPVLRSILDAPAKSSKAETVALVNVNGSTPQKYTTNEHANESGR